MNPPPNTPITNTCQSATITQCHRSPVPSVPSVRVRGHMKVVVNFIDPDLPAPLRSDSVHKDQTIVGGKT